MQSSISGIQTYGSYLSTDMWWLQFFCITGSITLTIIFIVYSCVWWKRLAVSRNTLIEKAQQVVVEARLSKILYCFTFLLCFSNYLKLSVYSGVLNKFRYWGLWQGSTDPISATDPNSIIQNLFPMFIYASSGGDPGTQIKTIILVTSGNLIRGTFTFLSFMSSHKMSRRLLFFIPILAITIFGVFYYGAAVLIFHYTQRFYTSQGELSLNPTENYMLACFVLAPCPLMWLLGSLALAATPKRSLDKANLSRIQLVFSGFKLFFIYGLVSIFCLYAITRAYNNIYNDQTAVEYPIWNIWKFFQYTMYIFVGWSILTVPCLCFGCGLKPLGEVLKSLAKGEQENRAEELMESEV